MIEFQNVSREYPGGTVALSDITLSIAQGELVFLSGPSGAGKSTLLKLIAAIERPSSGTLTVNGQDIGTLKRAAVPFLRRNMGLILQQQSLLVDRSILANVMLPMLVVGTSSDEADKRARAALERVGMHERAAALPLELSGGEQQRVEIARAIVNRPQIILADEPTTNLDRESAGKVIDALTAFKEAGVTCLISTHDDYFLHRASRVISLRQGRLANDRFAKAAKGTR
ncbi:MAG: ATP-binding cassette domain-containing protein [Burkholderiaceae bacterium]|nr:ATP-binding cassette domain-containing protein [Burkholderiaceae bacterium]